MPDAIGAGQLNNLEASRNGHADGQPLSRTSDLAGNILNQDSNARNVSSPSLMAP